MLFSSAAASGRPSGATFLAFREETGSRGLESLALTGRRDRLDSFLLVTVALLLAFVASFGLQGKTEGGKDYQ